MENALPPERLVSVFKRLSSVAAAIVALAGATVLIGYFTHNAFLKGIIPSIPPMNSASAILFLLAAASVFCLRDEGKHPWMLRVGIFFAAVIVIAGVVKMTGSLLGHDVYFDTHIFAAELSQETQATGRPNMMAVNVALGFFFEGLALLLLYAKNRERLAHDFAIATFFLALLSLLGYVYGVVGLLGMNGFTPVSLYTALAFLVLSIAILFAHPDRGVMPIMVDGDAAGIVMRRLLPIGVIVPILLDYLSSKAANLHWIPGALDEPLFAVANIFVFVFVLGWLGVQIRRIDADRRAAGEKLDDEKTKLEILLDSIGDGVIAIDRYWNITLWNKGSEALTGWKKDEALGKPFRSIVRFIRENSREENINFIESTMLLGTVHSMENHTLLVRRDGTEISVGDSASPVLDAHGQVNGAIIIFRDMTRERDAEKGRDEFSSLASHQLRSPIGVLKGFLKLFSDGTLGPLTDKQKESLTSMETAADSLHELVNAMLNVSRIESGTLAVSPEPVYLPDVADAVSDASSAVAAHKHITIEKKYGTDIPTINADPSLLTAVLTNLISNAVKYTPDGGKVTVAVARDPQNVLISVEDTGIGIPKLEQEKIFHKFFRAANAQSSTTEGTGLGLYAAQSILHQTGGTIRFVSEENKGTTFFVTLPVEGMRAKTGMKGLT